MAVPRHKKSKAAKRKRRTHLVLRAATTGECPQCHAKKLPHRICGNCGYYKDIQKIEVQST